MKTKTIFMVACLASAVAFAVNYTSRPDDIKPKKQAALPVSGDAIAFDFSTPFLNEILKRSEKDKVSLTVPRCANAPNIDGKISPDEWANAATIDALIFPDGAKAAPPARIRLMFDDSAIYIAAECDIPAGQKLDPLPAKPNPRDSKKIWGEDCLEIWLCPAASGRTFQFVLGADGTIFDLAGADSNYDPEWKHAAGRSASGWTVEMAIPKSALETADWPGLMSFNIGRNGSYVKTCSWTGDYGGTSQGQLKLEGIQKRAETDTDQSAEGNSVLVTKVMRSYARPGDRWIEIGVKMPLLKPPLDKYRLEAALFRVGDDQPVAQAGIAPILNRGTVLVDLRRLGLAEAQLRLTLLEGQKPIGISEMCLTARRPDQALEIGRKIPVLIDVPAGIEQVTAWPVTFGVPFPAGALWDVKQLRLVDKKGREIPSQVEATGLWAKEGAVKWARFDALVSSADGCFVDIGRKDGHDKTWPSTAKNVEGRGPSRPQALKLTEQNGEVTIDTGVSTYILGKGISPIKEIFLAGKRVATCEKTRGLYVIDQKGQVASASADKESMGVEASGTVSACVRFEGYYKTEKGENLARHITRVECFAGQASAKVTHTLVLCNDTGKVWFKDIGWEFAVGAGVDAKAIFGVSRQDWQKTCSVPLDSPTVIRSDSQTVSAYMLQDEHYFFAHGTNHFSVAAVDKQGKTKTVMEGGAALKKSTELAKGDLPPVASEAQGGECGDFACLAGTDNALLMGCRDTALQHPKEFEVSAGKITLHLFSSRAGEELDFRMPTLVRKWDLVNWYKNTLATRYKGDAEKIAEKVKNTISSDAIGWAKTHDLFVTPLAPADAAASAARLAYLNCREVYALISPEWTWKSGVMGPLHPKDVRRFPEAEQFIDATFRVWEKRLAEWGDYGFIYYFTGPHLQYNYSGSYAKPYRYAPLLNYTLRSDIWRAYIRSGDRSIREFAKKTNRVFGDSIMAHWDGGGKVKGLFVVTGSGDAFMSDNAQCLPLHWVGSPAIELNSTTDMNNLLYLYHLTGCRRAKDIVEEYGEGIKRFWTPAKAKKDSRRIMAMRFLLQTYALNWDPALREMAEATADLFADTEGEIGLTKDRADGPRSTYKTMTDIAGLFDAWEVTGNPRYHDLLLKVAQHHWRHTLGSWPVFYTNNQGRMGNFLYDETGNPAYAEMLALQVRQAASDYIPETKSVTGRAGAEASTFVFQGIPYAEDLMARTGADKEPVASWVAYEDFGFPSSIVLRKSDKGILDVEMRTDGKSEELRNTGAVGGIALRPIGIGTGSGLDLNSVIQRSGGSATIRVPKDAPEGAYEVLVPCDGFHIAVARERIPMVVYAPDYWRPAPTQMPPVKWFFNVPKDAKDAQIFFEGETRLYDPDGKSWPLAKGLPAEALAKAGKPLTGWVNLPADKPGLWAMEPIQSKLVRVRNLPPFFAARDPKSYFTPPISWEREEPFRPPEKPAAGTVYVPGAIQTPGNKALYLNAKRSFTLKAGEKHPSGDGSQFLPFKEGTIEFFFKPAWSTFDLPDEADKSMLKMDVVKGSPWMLEYIKNLQKESHVIYGHFMTDGPSRRIPMQARRKTIIQNGDWIHVAWVWGTRKGFTYSTAINSVATSIFVNGRLGKQSSYKGALWDGHVPADLPKMLSLGSGIEAAYDELRVSDVQRYKNDFTPPSPDRELPLDEHTRALFHFNGNCQGESHGLSGSSVTGEIK